VYDGIEPVEFDVMHIKAPCFDRVGCDRAGAMPANSSAPHHKPRRLWFLCLDRRRRAL